MQSAFSLGMEGSYEAMPRDFKEVKTSGNQSPKLADSELAGVLHASHAARDFSAEELAQQESSASPDGRAVLPTNVAGARKDGSTSEAGAIQDDGIAQHD